MSSRKKDRKRRESVNKSGHHVTPDMTSEELIETIRGKIQHVLSEKAKDPGHRDKR